LKKIKFKNIKVLFLDFDGVLTDNKVIVNEKGIESVRCSRSDSLYSDMIKNKFSLKLIVISSEKNRVVEVRCQKMKLPFIHGVSDKLKSINKFLIKNNLNFQNLAYIGNDLNDLEVMKKCNFKICPYDSVPEIKKISNLVLKTKGGDGVLKEVFNEFSKKKYEQH
tara:strand:+ start:1808 stop:2302 length:495 start_codon:yes stop_codon:yes gene_type:complete